MKSEHDSTFISFAAVQAIHDNLNLAQETNVDVYLTE